MGYLSEPAVQTDQYNHNPLDDRTFVRFAVYFAPRSGTKLAKFGETWFNLGKAERIDIIATPGRYGFHATLKAPFHLNARYSYADLLDCVEHLATVTAPVSIGFLQLKLIKNFYALVPQTECEQLNVLAFSCVKELDHFRRPLDKHELLRRQKTQLSLQQTEMLHKWGYPYVDETFQFHMTLTGALNSQQKLSVAPTLHELSNHACSEPTNIQDICIFGDPGQSKPFQLLERFALAGQQ